MLLADIQRRLGIGVADAMRVQKVLEVLLTGFTPGGKCPCGADVQDAPGIGPWCTRTGVDAPCVWGEKERSVNETFAPDQVRSAIASFLEYGEETFGSGQQGYFSGDGWAARCLRWHLAQLPQVATLTASLTASIEQLREGLRLACLSAEVDEAKVEALTQQNQALTAQFKSAGIVPYLDRMKELADRRDEAVVERDALMTAVRQIAGKLKAYRDAQQRHFGTVEIVHAGRCGAELMALLEAAERLTEETDASPLKTGE